MPAIFKEPASLSFSKRQPCKLGKKKKHLNKMYNIIMIPIFIVLLKTNQTKQIMQIYVKRRNKNEKTCIIGCGNYILPYLSSE